MKKLQFKNNFSQEFTKNKLPKLFIKILSGEILKIENQQMMQYINTHYHISTKQLILKIQKSLVISSYSDYILIYVDNNAKIRNINLDMILTLINNGNIEIRGTNIINNVIKNISQHLASLYKLSWMKGDAKLWE